MIITELNITGDFKSKSNSGTPKVYKKNDVVYLDGETYVASKTIIGNSPVLGESVGWVSLSRNQVFYETDTIPLFAKAGDEWFHTSTGIQYKRVSDDNGKHWIES
tara:strand:+ start:778 stop:1092 length:315 start_codon:yes stop_codon:yes gene_type:complete